MPYSREKYNQDPEPELSNGHLVALDNSDAALNARRTTHFLLFV